MQLLSGHREFGGCLLAVSLGYAGCRRVIDYSSERVAKLVAEDPYGADDERFHDPARPHLHSEDVDIALDIDRYDFAVRVDFEDGRPVARIETPAVTMPKSPT